MTDDSGSWARPDDTGERRRYTDRTDWTPTARADAYQVHLAEAERLLRAAEELTPGLDEAGAVVDERHARWARLTMLANTHALLASAAAVRQHVDWLRGEDGR